MFACCRIGRRRRRPAGGRLRAAFLLYGLGPSLSGCRQTSSCPSLLVVDKGGLHRPVVRRQAVALSLRHGQRRGNRHYLHPLRHRALPDASADRLRSRPPQPPRHSGPHASTRLVHARLGARLRLVSDRRAAPRARIEHSAVFIPADFANVDSSRGRQGGRAGHGFSSEEFPLSGNTLRGSRSTTAHAVRFATQSETSRR